MLRRQHPAELRLVEPVAGGAGGGADRRFGPDAVLVVRRALDPDRRPAAVAAGPLGRPVVPVRRAIHTMGGEGAPVLARVDDGVGRRRVPQFVGELARGDAPGREEHRDGAVAAPSALHAFEVIAPFALFGIDARVDDASPPRTQGVQGPVEQVARRQHRLVDLVQEAVVIAREGLQRRQREGEDSAEASHYFLGGPFLCLTPLTVARRPRVSALSRSDKFPLIVKLQNCAGTCFTVSRRLDKDVCASHFRSLRVSIHAARRFGLVRHAQTQLPAPNQQARYDGGVRRPCVSVG